LAGARTTWIARAECEAAIGNIFKDDFQILDALVGTSEALLRHLTNGDIGQVPNEVVYAVSSVAVRSHAIGHEISPAEGRASKPRRRSRIAALRLATCSRVLATDEVAGCSRLGEGCRARAVAGVWPSMAPARPLSFR
jgi:selenocysteine lyase/cysteine desulfurase